VATLQRAILSCHDKTGIVELAQLLHELGVEIVSTSGTLHVLQEAGIPAISIADFTGTPEMLGGRVKSLHPRVHAGLLALRDNKLHVEQMQEHLMEWVDMVVVNLPPLDELIGHPATTIEEVLQQTDIGGTAMIRSAAKNFRFVTVVVNPKRYPTLMHELRAHDGDVPFALRYKLAQEAFYCTADYDRAIADYLRSKEPPAE
jgi:phosphoribosylaminoimidazolecarboxamide formyltransferase/IMP cyclohydrolase